METVSSLAAGAPISLDALQTTPFIPAEAFAAEPEGGSLAGLARPAHGCHRPRQRGLCEQGCGQALEAGRGAVAGPRREGRTGQLHAGKPSRLQHGQGRSDRWTAARDCASKHRRPLWQRMAPDSTDRLRTRQAQRLPARTVEVTDSATNTARIVTTDGAGHYLVDALKPGSYRVGGKGARL